MHVTCTYTQNKVICVLWLGHCGVATSRVRTDWGFCLISNNFVRFQSDFDLYFHVIGSRCGERSTAFV